MTCLLLLNVKRIRAAVPGHRLRQAGVVGGGVVIDGEAAVQRAGRRLHPRLLTDLRSERRLVDRASRASDRSNVCRVHPFDRPVRDCGRARVPSPRPVSARHWPPWVTGIVGRVWSTTSRTWLLAARDNRARPFGQSLSRRAFSPAQGPRRGRHGQRGGSAVGAGDLLHDANLIRGMATCCYRALCRSCRRRFSRRSSPRRPCRRRFLAALRGVRLVHRAQLEPLIRRQRAPHFSSMMVRACSTWRGPVPPARPVP